MRNTREYRGTRVIGGRKGKKRIGKILRAVFSPEDYALVGYIVARPDFLFMIKRRDLFLAYDAFKIVDGKVLATIDRDSWDKSACKRLGIDWDECLILEGMDLVTKDGDKVGIIDSVEYNEHTGKAISIQVSSGIGTRAVLGVSSIPREMIIGYSKGQIIAKNAASIIQSEGGLAAKAGEQVAIVSNVVKEKTEPVRKTAKKIGKKVSRAGKVAGKTADYALDTGSKALGKQLGKTKGMFKAFKDEYKKESAKD